jgi:hypothetical protein
MEINRKRGKSSVCAVTSAEEEEEGEEDYFSRKI